ncbi:MAG: hypothetical protein COA47_02230 [Robiginitomaculum sp.]|nr:MAG: hypothetical protein COA47_02230 [Robiginitomaculum sp.]
MQNSAPITIRHLFLIWLGLMVLSLGTMIVGKVSTIGPLGPVWVSGLLLVTFIKAVLILDHFLELKQAHGPWAKLFISLIAAILLVLLVIYAVQSYSAG